MATATELLRAAEHLRTMPASSVLANEVHQGAAMIMEREAKRLQVDESMATRGAVSALRERWQEPRSGRSWPEGWPPFAVLRRAYELLDVTPTPSLLWLERHGRGDELGLRRRWARALEFVLEEVCR